MAAEQECFLIQGKHIVIVHPVNLIAVVGYDDDYND